MNSKYTISLLFYTICGLALWINNVEAGYPGFLCPISDQNNTIFFECATDCYYQHGASTGMCGPQSRGDYNCYCGRFAKQRREESLHCIRDDGNARQLCVVDCQCSHGAVTGVCDFALKACKCVGYDPFNTRCQMKTALEFAIFTKQMVDCDSPAWKFLGKFFPEHECSPYRSTTTRMIG